MSQPDSAPSKSRCTCCMVVLLGGVIALVVAYAWVAHVVQKVFGGAAMEHCCSIKGVPFNYLALFVLLCGFGAVVLLAIFLRVREWLARRDLAREYGVEPASQDGDAAAFIGSEASPSPHGVDFADDQ